MTQLAWFGGVALFFITLIFPIQFDRQWITIGWALEGAALLWLFHRVPHPGLRLAGVGLLVAAFVRLAFNPAVLEYHPRAATPIFNWYLYAYGIVTVCLFAGAKLLAPPRNQILTGINAPPILAGLRHGAGVPPVEHRNRRLLQRTRLDAHVPVQRRLCAGHDVFHRVGVVRAGVARLWHPQKHSRRALSPRWACCA